MNSHLRVLLALLCLGQMSAATAKCLDIVLDGSLLEFTASATNNVGERPFDVHGKFDSYDGTLCLSDNVTPDSTFHLSVDMSSVVMRDYLYKYLVKTADMLDVAHFPTATFDATSIEYHGVATDSDVKGKLTLHGVTHEVAFPATIKVNPPLTPSSLTYDETQDIIMLEGTVPVNRLDYGIGGNSWTKTDNLADSVNIHFKIFMLSKSMASKSKKAVPAPSPTTGGR